MPGFGHVSKAQIFMETAAAWGTRVITAGTGLEFDDLDLDLDIGILESKAIYSGLSARALHQMGIKGAGSFEVEAKYEGMAKLVASIMGALGTYVLTQDTVQTGTYRVGKTALGGVPSVSLEADLGGVNLPGGDSVLCTGVVVPRARFAINAGQGDDAMLRLSGDLLFKDLTPQSTTQYTAGVPAPSQTPIFFYQSLDASFLDGSGDAVAGVNVTGIEIEIESPLSERFFIAPAGRNMAQPLRDNRVRVTWRIRKEFTSWAAWLAAKNHTDGALKARFEGSTIPGSTPTPTNYAIEFSTPKAKARPSAPRINEWGILEQNVEWVAYNDVTDGPLKLTLVQSKASEATAGA